MARAYNQAQKFGAQMVIPAEVTSLQAPQVVGGIFQLRLSNGERVSARSVVVASGARYRRLTVENLANFEAASVHYWASASEGKLVAGQEVALIGGGNSAGQATVYLASYAAKVWLLVRGADLAASMSRYLVDRITGLANVGILTRTCITGVEGHNGMLEAVRWRQAGSTEVQRPIRHLFLFTGADPNTDWLEGSGVALDAKRFVLTGNQADSAGRPLETSMHGVFAIGDVRSGSVKRVAAAVGEGAQVVATLHDFLAAKDSSKGTRGCKTALDSPQTVVRGPEITTMAEDGLITIQSDHDFLTTLERLLSALKEKGVTVFCRVDHAAGAASVSLPLRPMTLVVFGNPAAGTLLMQAAQTAGIDLPLKVLVWEDADGSVKLTYNSPSWIAARHELGSQVNQAVAAMTTALKMFAFLATGH